MASFNRRTLFTASAGALMLAAPVASVAVAAPVRQSVPDKRVLDVVTDNMEPVLRVGTDQIVVVAVVGWEGPGCYLIDNGGQETPYRCERHIGTTDIRLTSDNPAYPPHRVTQAWFEENQRGRVQMVARSFL